MEAIFIHKEWNDICIIDYNYIKRKNIQNETGFLTKINDEIIIKWDHWIDKDIFMKREDYYVDEQISGDISTLTLRYKDRDEDCILIGDVIASLSKKTNGYCNFQCNKLNIIWDKYPKECFLIINDEYIEEVFHYSKKKDDKNSNKKYISMDSKNTFRLIDNTYYSLEYIEKKEEKAFVYTSNKLHGNKNIHENYFFNKLNPHYIDYSNFEKMKEHYIIDALKCQKKYFQIKADFFISPAENAIVTISEWGYPAFGGGENWLLNMNKIFHELSYDPYFICFSNGFTGEPFTVMKLIDLEYCKVIQMPFHYHEIAKLIRLIDPVCINHQGIKRLEILKLASLFEIPMITGFCFWNNIIKPVHNNINILENETIEKDESFHIIEKYCQTYSASPFVNDVIQKFFGKKVEVIETISLKENYLITENTKENIYVSMVNCHSNKGGFLLKRLIHELPIEIPLLLVYTEKDDHLPLESIKKMIEKRNRKNPVNLLFEEKKDIQLIYSMTKIMLIPSLCDETFCRVAYESKMNQIPILSLKSGNLTYLLKDYAVFLDKDPTSWIDAINQLYNNPTSISPDQMLIDSFEKECKEKIKNIILQSKKKNYKLRNNNIGLIAPWADQGLGIQARSYYHSLKEINYNPCILSYKPYHGCEENNYLQNNKKEWDYENITYSKNTREELQIEELIEFIFLNKCKKIVIIEATFEPIFKLLSFLKICGIEIYNVVNIECIRISELNNHSIFDKILCNNYNSYFVMNQFFPKSTSYLGFHLESEYIKKYIKINKIDLSLRFVCVGGLNSISRKNIDKLIELFEEILPNYKDIELHVYIQGVETHERLFDVEYSKIYIYYYSYEMNLKNISQNDIFIHLGGQEGLGLGFYEALYLGLPILTLNWTPNNEIIQDDKNGWLVKCKYGTVHENPECLIQRGIVDQTYLKDKIIKIIENRENTINIIKNTISNSHYYQSKNKKKFNQNLSSTFHAMF